MTLEEKYPQHAKLQALKEQKELICRFIDWLHDRDMVLCDQLPDEKDRDGQEWPGEIVPTSQSKQQLLSAFFEIDADALSQEKDAMYREAAMQAQSKS